MSEPQIDSRIDAYIERSADFAQPILRHIRQIVHTNCPDVIETIKWGFPHFDYRGIMCSMAAFKTHCAFNFWKGELLQFESKSGEAMGQFGRIVTLKDLPAKPELAKFIKAAMKLNEDGVPSPRIVKSRAVAVTSPRELAAIAPPDYLMALLKKNKKALATFEGFSNSNEKEYIVWITDAKTDITRNSRIAQAIEWMAEGKIRNWKYDRK